MTNFVTETLAEGENIAFGDVVPDGFTAVPAGDVDDFGWQASIKPGAVRQIYVEHAFGKRSAHQLADFLIAVYNILPPGGRLRLVEADQANPTAGYREMVADHGLRTTYDFARLTGVLTQFGFAAQGVEFHDAEGKFHLDEILLRCHGLPARSRIVDRRGQDPAIKFSSLVVDAIKTGAGRADLSGFSGPRLLALGDSHSRFLAGKDDTEGGEIIPHARLYQGFAAYFDAFHLGPGLAWNLDREGSTTRIFERVNTLIDTAAIERDRQVVFSFGEIDCRSHVVKQAERQGRTIEVVVAAICARYRNFLAHMLGRGVPAAVWGPVASTPNQNYADPNAPAVGTLEQRNHAITCFNAMMRDVCGELRIPFLSIVDQLIGPDGRTRASFYCDDIHLSQRARTFLWELMPEGRMPAPPPAPAPVILSERVPAGRLEVPIARAVSLFKANGGWTWFQDERVISLGQKLLIGSAAGKTRADSEAGDIDLTIFDTATGARALVKLRERFQPDDHDAPSFLRLADGHLLAGYQAHPAAGMEGQNLMRWRRSLRPDDPTTWAEEQALDVGGRVSYCHLAQLAGEGGRIYSFFRGPDSRPHYLVSEDGGVSFRHAGRLMWWDFDTADKRWSGRDGFRPYVKYTAGGSDLVHVMCTEDHPRAWPNSIYHARLRGGMIEASDGTVLGPMGAGNHSPVRVDQLTRVFQGSEGAIAWPMDMHLDAAGHPVLLFSTRDGDEMHRLHARAGGTKHRYHYARWDGAAWVVHTLCHGGSALYADEEDFTGLAALDPEDAGTVYVSTNVDPLSGVPLANRLGRPRFEIFRGQSGDRGASWSWAAVTSDSEIDNIRPVIPSWPGDRRAVLWMRGHYTTFTNYDTDIVGFIETR